MIIQLEKFEIEAGAMVGLKRKVESLWKRKDRITKPEDWSSDLESALAELAVARALGKYWAFTVNTFRTRADVGDYEVRHTTLEDGQLIIRPKDSPQATYILVRGFAPTYNIVGFIKGEDGMNKKYIRNPGGLGAAFFIPEDKLKPIELLIE